MPNEIIYSHCRMPFEVDSLSLQSVCPICLATLTPAGNPSPDGQFQNWLKPTCEPSTQIHTLAGMAWRAMSMNSREPRNAVRNAPLNWLSQCLMRLGVLSAIGFVLFLLAPFRPPIVLFGSVNCFAFLFLAGLLLTFTQSHPNAREFGRAILAICAMVGITGAMLLAFFVLLISICARI